MTEYLTQALFNIFLETEVPSIISGLSVENLQRFTNLCCQLVEKYQDGVLMERKYKCGKNNKWKRKKY